MSEYSTFDICVEPIELYKLLKISNMVDGCEAKTMISEGNISVNNKVTIQKRKKIRHGDIIEFNGKRIKITYNPSKKSAEFIDAVVSVSKNAKKKKRARIKALAIASKTAAEPSKRKPT